MKFFQTIFCLSVCLTAAYTVFSQSKNPIQQPPVMIKANVMVLDSKEQLADVKAEDLKIYEDGIEQKISKLTKKESLNLGLVIDNTGSMRTQLSAIVGTANLIVENLRDSDEAFAVRFISSNNISLVQNWTSNKNDLKKSLNNMYIEGGQSAVIDALKMSADLLLEKKDDAKRSALILISDCEDRASFYKLEAVLKTLKDNNIEIYVIGFTQELDKSPREKAVGFGKLIASQSGGAAYFPKYSRNNSDQIIEAAKAIVLELRSQYVVEYVSTNSNPKAVERKLKVEIINAPNGEKLSAFTRPVIEIGKTETKK